MDWESWPNLILLDFFWNIMCEEVTDISHIKRRIMAAIETVTPEMLHKTRRREIEYVFLMSVERLMILNSSKSVLVLINVLLAYSFVIPDVTGSLYYSLEFHCKGPGSF
ncbi:hypothetical protein AVEN_30990-1 [Araneus ventricosus]|uniref:Uncharacterized protein n=1 Tax=Araneus ventricosus TaxID=182803 RepID=A0A4Y2KH14_ARAVE|nr:hypothetical protein AVEN_30990-1 [Araneus ventricosus]